MGTQVHSFMCVHMKIGLNLPNFELKKQERCEHSSKILELRLGFRQKLA